MSVEEYAAYLGGVDFEQPIPLGVQMASLDEAQQYLPFDPYRPIGLGDPTRILINGPEASPDPYRVVALVYDDTPYGIVDILETVSQVTSAGWSDYAASVVARNGQPDTQETGEIVSIREGLSALVTTPDGSHSIIEWVQGGMEFQIVGPTLDGAEALAVANSI